jgi:sugar-specific transcriptional regulator TrmB
MDALANLKDLGFSQYEATCYMALLADHPINGSRLSAVSNIARSRIYDVLRSMTVKGFVLEVSKGLYAPLPPDELIFRLTTRFKGNVKAFEKEVARVFQRTECEYIWTLTGYDTVMAKAGEMIKTAKSEIYTRLFPDEARILSPHLEKAQNRGVNIRYIAMGDTPITFEVQVAHPDQKELAKRIGGASFDLIKDRNEALVGVFETENQDNSSINWTRNPWFITTNRDSLRHDFYHCFLKKIHEDNQQLNDHEKNIYNIIKDDN